MGLNKTFLYLGPILTIVGASILIVVNILEHKKKDPKTEILEELKKKGWPEGNIIFVDTPIVNDMSCCQFKDTVIRGKKVTLFIEYGIND